MRAGCPNLIERIEAGLYSYGNDMTIEHNPLECGLEKYCRLDGDHDFMARAALEKLVADGGPQRQMRGVTFEGTDCPACVEAWPLHADGQLVGSVTSAAYSPDLSTNIGFAMVDKTAWEIGQDVTVHTPAGTRQGKVAAIPFI